MQPPSSENTVKVDYEVHGVRDGKEFTRKLGYTVKLDLDSSTVGKVSGQGIKIKTKEGKTLRIDKNRFIANLSKNEFLDRLADKITDKTEEIFKGVSSLEDLKKNIQRVLSDLETERGQAVLDKVLAKEKKIAVGQQVKEELNTLQRQQGALVDQEKEKLSKHSTAIKSIEGLQEGVSKLSVERDLLMQAKKERDEAKTELDGYIKENPMTYRLRDEYSKRKETFEEKEVALKRGLPQDAGEEHLDELLKQMQKMQEEIKEHERKKTELETEILSLQQRIDLLGKSKRAYEQISQAVDSQKKEEIAAALGYFQVADEGAPEAGSPKMGKAPQPVIHGMEELRLQIERLKELLD